MPTPAKEASLKTTLSIGQCAAPKHQEGLCAIQGREGDENLHIENFKPI